MPSTAGQDVESIYFNRLCVGKHLPRIISFRQFSFAIKKTRRVEPQLIRPSDGAYCSDERQLENFFEKLSPWPGKYRLVNKVEAAKCC